MGMGWEMTEQEFIGGYRPDKTIWKLKLHLPPFTVRDQDVTAVAGIYLQSGKILAVKNSRGWDIPGGHVEPGETPTDALIRELSEEAAFDVSGYNPIAYLETAYVADHKTFMIIYTVNGSQRDFIPFDEISACRFMSIDEFLAAYTAGSQDLMRQLIAISSSSS
jgi:8-oxo-dGTP pyrophosphatase MutT (NUDIX family)